MRKDLIAILAVFIVACVATTVVAQDKGPGEVKFSTKKGTVTFNHAQHQGVTDCATCHHMGDSAACRSCHGVDKKAPKAKKVFHKLCKSCHKKQKQGPTKCKGCHVK